jgi:hypothetical protein
MVNRVQHGVRSRGSLQASRGGTTVKEKGSNREEGSEVREGDEEGGDGGPLGERKMRKERGQGNRG